MTERTCGTCTLCCKLMEITDLNKPGGTLCQHCAVGKGCKIYEARPGQCREWRCGWLRNPHMWDDTLRPNECGFIITVHTDGKSLELICDEGLMKSARRQRSLESFLAVARRVWPGDVVVTTR